MQEQENQLIKVRLEKLNKLRANGTDPYPHRYERSHSSKQASLQLESEEAIHGDDARTDAVSLAGRIVGFRRMGKASFIDLLDGDGRIQVLLRRNLLPNTYTLLNDLDIGDWIGAIGPLFRTKTGEVTLEANKWVLLSKSLRPLPEKWHGLADVETRYRQRYVDLIANEEARRIALMRSRIIKSLRDFMDDRSYIEVETPLLVPIAAGGTASPFSTHYNALNRDLFLRIATELYLKRLIVGGFEKVYEIGKVFRNEGLDLTHNPEFTMMESYEAFSDYNDMMNLVQDIVCGLAQTILGKTTVEYGEHKIDLAPPWPRLNLRDEIKQRTGIDFIECSDLSSLRAKMVASGLDVGQQISWGGLMDKLLSITVEPLLIQPTFLVDYPVDMSPLAKRKENDPRLVERFEGFVAGMEICNAFTELNDPVDQRKRLQQQETLQAEFQHEDMDRLDEDFLVALEYGMPPTGGLGIGIDRLVMLFSSQTSIREVTLFPQLRDK